MRRVAVRPSVRLSRSDRRHARPGAPAVGRGVHSIRLVAQRRMGREGPCLQTGLGSMCGQRQRQPPALRVVRLRLLWGRSPSPGAGSPSRLSFLLTGGAWTLGSRIPSGGEMQGPIASPRVGFAAPDFTFDLLGGGQRRHLPLWRSLNALTPSLSAFPVSVGVAHLSSGDAFGTPASMPWAIELWGARRHPTQVYEILLGLLTFGRMAPRADPDLPLDSCSSRGSRSLRRAACSWRRSEVTASSPWTACGELRWRAWVPRAGLDADAS